MATYVLAQKSDTGTQFGAQPEADVDEGEAVAWHFDRRQIP